MSKDVKLRKANRIITVSSDHSESYLRRGYDQIDEKGKVVKKATGGKSISVAEYNKVVEQLEKEKEKSDGVSQEEYDKLQKDYEELEKDRDKYKEYAEKARAKLKGSDNK